MSPIQSKEEVASSIASGIASSSSSIISGNKVDLENYPVLLIYYRFLLMLVSSLFLF